MSKYDSIVVTPNVLTECTNLAGENKKGEAELPEHRALRELITDGNVRDWSRVKNLGALGAALSNTSANEVRTFKTVSLNDATGELVSYTA